MPEILDIATEKMNKTISVMKQEYNSLRAGRANPQALDHITADYYGTPTPINQMGNISVPEPRMLIISLWDTKLIPVVEKAIQKSDLGINPANDGKVIRLIFPELTQERRKELAKVIRKKAEESKVAVRPSGGTPWRTSRSRRRTTSSPRTTRRSWRRRSRSSPTRR